MRGLIYKDFSLFYKSLNKKMLLFGAAAVILLIIKGGAYAGILSSIMLSLLVGMQNLMCFISDESADWTKYQSAMPVSSLLVVGSRYVSILCTLGISFAGSILLNLISGIAYYRFDPAQAGTAAALSVIIPMLWTGICVPLVYWLGTSCIQLTSFFMIVPTVYIIKFFEDGPGLSVITETSLPAALLAAAAVSAGVFAVSLALSTAGYAKHKDA